MISTFDGNRSSSSTSLDSLMLATLPVTPISTFFDWFVAEVDVSVAILNVIVIRWAADHETNKKKMESFGLGGDGGELLFFFELRHRWSTLSRKWFSVKHVEKENFFNHGYVYLIPKYYKSKRIHVLTDTFQIFIGPRFKVCVRAIQIT